MVLQWHKIKQCIGCGSFFELTVLFFVNLQIHTDSDEGEGNIKYTISGEGAGSIFIIDELTGDIHATERLDREEKAFYTLRARARDRLSNDLLEPESEFVIKVQDINDSEPKFLEGPYIGSVAELSPIGKARNIVRSDRDHLDSCLSSEWPKGAHTVENYQLYYSYFHDA